MTLTKFNEILSDLRPNLGMFSLVCYPEGTDKIYVNLNDAEDMFVCRFTFNTTLLMRNGKVEFFVTFIESDYERQRCGVEFRGLAKEIVKRFEQEI